MSNDDDVLDAIAACNSEDNTPTKVIPQEKPPVPVVELSQGQKEIIIRYMLGSIGKGIFEDVPIFWDGIPDDKVDELYEAYRNAAQKFVDQLREYAITIV